MAERILNDWLTGYIELNKNTEPPELYHLWVGIGTIAAALQRTSFLDWDRRLFPNKYIVLVGPSGARKNSAMYPAQEMLRELGVRLSADSTTREALIRELNEASGIVEYEDGTVESHASLTIFSKELTVFLGYNNTQLVRDLTDWYDCDSRWRYSTKDKKLADDIKGVWVNIIGGTTPKSLRQSLPVDAIGEGLGARMIFVYEEKEGKKISNPSKTEREIQLGRDLVQDLMEIHRIKGEYKVTKAFRGLWKEWYESTDGEEFKDTFLEPYASRRGTHLLKLCMIINASSKGNRLIDVDEFEKGLYFMKKVEKKMPYTFRGVGLSDIAEIVARVTGLVETRKEMWFSEILDYLGYDADKVTGWRAIDLLQARKFLKVVRHTERDDFRIIKTNG